MSREARMLNSIAESSELDIGIRSAGLWTSERLVPGSRARMEACTKIKKARLLYMIDLEMLVSGVGVWIQKKEISNGCLLELKS